MMGKNQVELLENDVSHIGVFNFSTARQNIVSFTKYPVFPENRKYRCKRFSLNFSILTKLFDI